MSLLGAGPGERGVGSGNQCGRRGPGRYRRPVAPGFAVHDDHLCRWYGRMSLNEAKAVVRDAPERGTLREPALRRV
jgi:hypothetical protein